MIDADIPDSAVDLLFTKHYSLLKNISQLIFNAGDKIDEESIRAAAKKDGMLTLRESGFERVRMGLTSFEEVLSNTADD